MQTRTRNKTFLALALFALIPLQGVAQTTSASGDLADLQAQVDNYLAPATTNELNSLLDSYSALKLGQTYTPDSPALGPVSDGTADAKWTKLSYTDLSASKLIGYASDQCVSHTTYDQLIAKGVKADKAKFNDVRDKFCKLVKASAELKHRYDKYQAIKTNGVVLVKRAKSQGHDFAGRHRTFGGGIDLVYKPDIAGTLENGVHPDETFQYHSWIKWSDDNSTALNLIKRIREMRNDTADRCEGFSIQIIDGGSVRAYMYLNVVNVSSSRVTIQNCMKAVYNGTHKTHAFPPVTMDAPFGYLYELEQMKDSAKAKLKDQLKDKVVSMVGANQQMIDLLKKIK